MPDVPTDQPLRYEDAVQQLEAIINRVESGAIGLEEALTQYQHGMKLLRHCLSILDRAETTIQKLQIPADQANAAAAEDDDFDDTEYGDPNQKDTGDNSRSGGGGWDMEDGEDFDENDPPF